MYRKPKPRMIKPGRRQPAECIVSGALGMVLRASQLVGIAPLTFRRNNQGWTVTMSPTLCLFSYIIATVINVGALTGLFFDLHGKPSEAARVRSPTRRFVWVCDFIIVLVTGSVAAYGAPRRLRHTIVCLAKIQKINMATAPYNKSLSEWKISAAFALYLIFVISLFTADYWDFVSDVLYYNRQFTAACLYSCYYYAYVMLILFEMQYIFSALEVTKSMTAVNNIIEEVSRLINLHSTSLNATLPDYPTKLIPTKSVNMVIDSIATIRFDTGFMVSPASKSINETIRRLASMYNVVCDAVRQLDGCHGVGLMLLLLSFLLHMVITPYNLIVNISSSRKVDMMTLAQLLWCGLHFSCTVAVVEPSHRTQLEIDRTSLLISRMIIKSNDELISSELEKFSTYLLLNKVTYSPLGVCTLTRSLVASIVGSVATYLVIIIQFQLSE